MLNDVHSLLRDIQDQEFVAKHLILTGEVGFEAATEVAKRLDLMLRNNFFQYVRSYHGQFDAVQPTERAQLRSLGWVNQAVIVNLRVPDQHCIFTHRHNFLFLQYRNHTIATFTSVLTLHNVLKETFIVETMKIH